MSVEWDYFDKFDKINEKYLPEFGEGETVATQVVTAVNKLVYKWYNDGDVFDNTGILEGWCNNLSSYANWLKKYTSAGHLLDAIYACYTEDSYEDLLKDLADELLDDEFLEKQSKIPKIGTIYKCDGPYKFEEPIDDDWN